ETRRPRTHAECKPQILEKSIHIWVRAIRWRCWLSFLELPDPLDQRPAEVHMHRSNFDVDIKAQDAGPWLFESGAIDSYEGGMHRYREYPVGRCGQPDGGQGGRGDGQPNQNARKPSSHLHGID